MTPEARTWKAVYLAWSKAITISNCIPPDPDSTLSIPSSTNHPCTVRGINLDTNHVDWQTHSDCQNIRRFRVQWLKTKLSNSENGGNGFIGYLQGLKWGYLYTYFKLCYLELSTTFSYILYE